jgi:hypothetical protein
MPSQVAFRCFTPRAGWRDSIFPSSIPASTERFSSGIGGNGRILLPPGLRDCHFCTAQLFTLGCRVRHLVDVQSSLPARRGCHHAQAFSGLSFAHPAGVRTDAYPVGKRAGHSLPGPADSSRIRSVCTRKGRFGRSSAGAGVVQISSCAAVGNHRRAAPRESSCRILRQRSPLDFDIRVAYRQGGRDAVRCPGPVDGRDGNPLIESNLRGIWGVLTGSFHPAWISTLSVTLV